MLQPDATFDVDIKTSTGSIDNEFNLDGISERKMVKGYVKESGVNSLKIRPVRVMWNYSKLTF